MTGHVIAPRNGIYPDSKHPIKFWPNSRDFNIIAIAYHIFYTFQLHPFVIIIHCPLKSIFFLITLNFCRVEIDNLNKKPERGSTLSLKYCPKSLRKAITNNATDDACLHY